VHDGAGEKVLAAAGPVGRLAPLRVRGPPRLGCPPAPHLPQVRPHPPAPRPGRPSCRRRGRRRRRGRPPARPRAKRGRRRRRRRRRRRVPARRRRGRRRGVVTAREGQREPDAGGGSGGGVGGASAGADGGGALLPARHEQPLRRSGAASPTVSVGVCLCLSVSVRHVLHDSATAPATLVCPAPLSPRVSVLPRATLSLESVQGAEETPPWPAVNSEAGLAGVSAQARIPAGLAVPGMIDGHIRHR
jgi:hypothetical protein